MELLGKRVGPRELLLIESGVLIFGVAETMKAIAVLVDLGRAAKLDPYTESFFE